MTIGRVGVVGCGLMGAGIAQTSAQSGFPTVVREVSPAALEQGMTSIRRFLDGGVAKGKLTADARDRTLANLRGTTALEDLGECDLVIEAVPEQIALKREVLEALDARCPDATIFASNTSSLSITELAAFTRRADRFLGLHFFNPVPLMQLVEVVRTLATSDATIESAVEWCRAAGKTVVRAGDTPGFIVNRLLVPYMLDAIRAFEQGTAGRDDIDTAMKLGCGYPMGPLLLADYVGLDTTCSIGDILFAEFKEPRFAPPPLLRRMVRAGRHGRKSGRGFYDWSTQPPS
jgi:3-hydroxybutyryl-CoA dehydrogenase